MINALSRKSVAAHIYEHTTQSMSRDACFLCCLMPSAVSVTLSNEIGPSRNNRWKRGRSDRHDPRLLTPLIHSFGNRP